MIKRDNIIEHFDSYGMMPDDELKFVPDIFRMHNNMSVPHLTYLLINLPEEYRIEFNEHKLQKKGINIKTCGRHVASRINNKDIPIEEYAKYFLNNDEFDADDLVVINNS